MAIGKKSFSTSVVLSVWLGRNIPGSGRSPAQDTTDCNELLAHLLGRKPNDGESATDGPDCAASLGRQLQWLEQVPEPPASDDEMGLSRWLRQQVSDFGPRHAVVPMSEEQ